MSVDTPEVGVGPWPGDWPSVGPGFPYDPTLLAEGDRRNVVDKYRYWSVEAIVADLDTNRVPLHIAFENTEHDLNIGSVVRTANAFNVSGVHVVGRRRWNRRGAMVTDRYLHLFHHPTAEDFISWAATAGIPLIGVDNLPGSVPMETYPFPASCVLLFGTESTGLSEEILSGCVDIVHITQAGSTRSLNVAAAAAIAMYAWATQSPK